MLMTQAALPDDDALGRDLAHIEEKLAAGVRSSLTLPRELGDRLVKAGGKRIRPLLMCASYRSFQGRNLSDRCTLEDLHTLAAVAEWVHTATLFHDDVLDASPTRRDLPSAHMLHGNKIAILVGDFVYAEAFSLLMDRGLMEPSRELASTIKKLVEGELLQCEIARNRELDFNDYLRVANAKTAALFSWCTGTGAWAAGSPLVAMAQDFGAKLGLAFQMADDLFDTYTLTPHQAQKAELVEWVESAPPLPLVLAGEQVSQLWKPVEPNADRIAEMQRICRDPALVKRCLDEIESCLDTARGLLKIFGSHPILSTSIELIHARALEGVQLAQRPGPNA